MHPHIFVSTKIVYRDTSLIPFLDELLDMTTLAGYVLHHAPLNNIILTENDFVLQPVSRFLLLPSVASCCFCCSLLLSVSHCCFQLPSALLPIVATCCLLLLSKSFKHALGHAYGSIIIYVQDTHNVNSNETLRKESTCAVPIVYTESVCQEELLSLKSCYIDNNDTDANYPAVATDAHIKDAELALSYLRLGLATDECEAEVVPFLCLYFFGLCDVTTENSYQPSACQCRNLRDRVCKQEWMYAVNFGLELPDCDVDFPAKSESCRDKADGKGTYPNLCNNY